MPQLVSQTVNSIMMHISINSVKLRSQGTMLYGFKSHIRYNNTVIKGEKVVEGKNLFGSFQPDNTVSFILLHPQSSRWAFWKACNGFSAARGLMWDYLAIG